MRKILKIALITSVVSLFVGSPLFASMKHSHKKHSHHDHNYHYTKHQNGHKKKQNSYMMKKQNKNNTESEYMMNQKGNFEE